MKRFLIAALLLIALCLSACSGGKTDVVENAADTSSVKKTEDVSSVGTTGDAEESASDALSSDSETEADPETDPTTDSEEEATETEEPGSDVENDLLNWANDVRSQMKAQGRDFGFVILDSSVDPLIGSYSENKAYIDSLLANAGIELPSNAAGMDDYYVDACNGSGIGGSCVLAIIVLPENTKMTVYSGYLDFSTGEYVTDGVLFKTPDNYSGTPIIVQWASGELYDNILIETASAGPTTWSPSVSGMDGSITFVSVSGSGIAYNIAAGY